MSVIIRDATIEDIDILLELGKNDGSFSVSKKVQFYERDELIEWVRNPKSNILCVAYQENILVGFFFCKIMSYHWAMLDTLYVIPEVRKNQVGQRMLDELMSRLQLRAIEYVTTLLEPRKFLVESFLRMNDFDLAKSYNWYEYWL